MNNDQIPEEFYSFETKTPFEYCIECGKYLLEEGTEYLIEKAIKNYEGFSAQDVIFDYAICMDCADDLRKQISKQSWESMLQYFQENMDVGERLGMGGRSSKESLSRCIIKKKKIEECGVYQVFAHCNGRRIDKADPPYVISDEVMEELMPILSDVTIDEMNGFFDKHFSPDPSFFEFGPKLVMV